MGMKKGAFLARRSRRPASIYLSIYLLGRVIARENLSLSLNFIFLSLSLSLSR